jgi:hypothetical protein
MQDICKVSDGTGVMSKEYFDTLFGAGFVLGWRNIPQTVSLFFFVRKKNRTVSK